MTYHFACDDCRVSTTLERPIEHASLPAACPICNEAMRRIFYAPAMLNRQKPGTFRWDKCKLDAWDDRLAHLKDVEEKKGTEGLREVRTQVGEQLWHETLAHKKERYG